MSRRECPPEVSVAQESALVSHFIILSEFGPTAWLIADPPSASVKVSLGSIHTCTCSQFTKSKELCVHILWILIKKLKLSPGNPFSWQKGLSDPDLNSVLHPVPVVKPKVKPFHYKYVAPKSHLAKSCPICLVEFAPGSAVLHCKYGCGQPVHSRCMAMLIGYSDEPEVTCPLCRGKFSTLSELKRSLARPKPEHDVHCCVCPATKSRGSVYKCLKCAKAEVCSKCIKSDAFQKTHFGHGVAVKTALNSKWTALNATNLQALRRSSSDEPSPKCPICDTEETNLVTLECGHLVTSDPTPSPVEVDRRQSGRVPCGRIARKPNSAREYTPPPEVIVHRVELSSRRAVHQSGCRRAAKPTTIKKKEIEELEPPDMRENGRILGSKVLPLMALLLQKKATGEESSEDDWTPPVTASPVSRPSKKLAVQCIQLLPEGETQPAAVRPKKHPRRRARLSNY